jgi:hypothetical protein
VDGISVGYSVVGLYVGRDGASVVGVSVGATETVVGVEVGTVGADVGAQLGFVV